MAAFAETSADTPAQNAAVDLNGVDLTTGSFPTASPLQFNAPGAGHLNFQTFYNGHKLTFPLNVYMDDETFSEDANPQFRNVTLNVGGVGRLFTCPLNGVCGAQIYDDGSVLTKTGDYTYNFVDRDGVKYEFYHTYNNALPYCDSTNSGCNSAGYFAYYYVSKIKYPSGETLTFQPFSERLSDSVIRDTISSNLGYKLTLTRNYPQSSGDSTTEGGNWTAHRNSNSGVTTIELFHGSTRVAGIASTFSSNYDANVGSVTDADLDQSDDLSRHYRIHLHMDPIVWCTGSLGSTCAYTPARDLTQLVPRKVTSPGGVIKNITYSGYTIGQTLPVTSVNDGLNTWKYNYSRYNMEVTDPQSGKYNYAISPGSNPWQSNYDNSPDPASLDRHLTSFTDPNNKVTQYTFLPALGRNVVAGLPRGNGYIFSPSNRYNISTVFAHPKSGNDAKIWSAHYPDSCPPAAAATCNKPDWVEGGNSNRTTYSYYDHGGINVATKPADHDGHVLKTTYTYTGFDTGAGVLQRLTREESCFVKADGTCDGIKSQKDITYWGATFLTQTVTSSSSDTSGTLTTSYSYDDAGRLTTQTAPSGASTNYLYDVAGRKIGIIGADPDGSGALPRLAQRISYNNDDQIIKVEEGNIAGVNASDLANMVVAKTTENTYNSIGQKIKDTVASGGVISVFTQYSYDTVGRLECTAVRMDPGQWGSQTNACVPQLSGSKGPDRITKNVYDPAGQLIQVRKAVGVAGLEQAYVTYSYTDNGKQENVIDANGNRAKMDYDGFDRLWNWFFPSATKPSAFDGSSQANALASAGSPNNSDFEQYGYDANDNRITLRKRDGSTLGYSYDALNRIYQKVVPGRSDLSSPATQSVFYGYDIFGHQTYARFGSAGGEGATSVWNGLGRQTASTLSMDGKGRTLSYLYDVDGNLTQITFPENGYAVGYRYDGLGRPDRITRSDGAVIASYTYDAAGRRCKMETNSPTGACSDRTSGVAALYLYDGIDRLSSITNSLSNAPYNNTFGFAYNPASQITELSKSNNSYSFANIYNVNRAYSANGLNQYSDAGLATGPDQYAAGAAHFTYDLNGNLKGDGSQIYIYDIENRLVSARDPNSASGPDRVSLRYDPLGRLYESSGPSGTVRFLYNGDALVAEYDSSGNVLRRYVHGTDATADDPIAWYEGSGFGDGNERMLRQDWQGSIAMIADRNGSNVFGVNTYDDYGIPGSKNTGRFQYTGQAWQPDLGMYYYKARFYSPNLGRFLQVDPIGYKDQVNLYSYVGNDPVNNRDPSGLYTCQGSSENCGAFAASLQRGRDALASGNLSKSDRSAISGVLKTYGKEGFRNGVGVTFRATAQIRAVATGAAYTQFFPRNGVSLVVLPDNYSKMYNNFVAQEKGMGTSDSILRGFSPRDERANIAFHEGRHAEDQQAGRTVLEPPAYQTGEAINRAYGSRSVRVISNEKTGEDEHDY